MTNIIVLEGNLVEDAVLKAVGESSVTEFRIANNRYISKGKQRTTFIKCVWWGSRGAAVYSYLTKGKRVTVEGKFEIDEWPDAKGEKHSQPVINVPDVSLGASVAREGGGRPEYSGEQTTRNSGDSSIDDGEFHDDIPF
jgi:single stranded DNA-binding protein